ncbi:MAG: MBL fold metallo-hydrolase [Clostridia bacterium]|nr:MBL fold metallo-hydrolase [Clostridia bacterium]
MAQKKKKKNKKMPKALRVCLIMLAILAVLMAVAVVLAMTGVIPANTVEDFLDGFIGTGVEKALDKIFPNKLVDEVFVDKYGDFVDWIMDLLPKPERVALDGEIMVYFFDVGQSDSILIMAPQGNVLIDAGDNDCEDALKGYLDDLGVTTLNVVIATHPHEDHIGSMDMIFDEFTVNNLFMPNAEVDTDTFSATGDYTRMMEGAAEQGTQTTYVKGGNTFSFGDLYFEFLAPNSTDYNDLNDWSLVTKVTYGSTSMILTGDAESISEKEIVAKYASSELDCDILKSGHHGSSSSSCNEFLDAIDAEIAIISCGTGNKYGHPNQPVLDRYEERGMTVHRTDLEGTIVYSSNGAEFKRVP